MPETFDAIIIGAGQAGPFLAARLADKGMRTALIERKHLGGTCVNDGCTPTKTMVASARIAHMARRAVDYGVVAGPVSVDFDAIRRRRDGIVGDSRQGLEDWLGGMDNVEIIRGTGRFSGRSTVEVNGRSLKADRIFINAGCRAAVPDWPGIDAVPYLTNTTIMDLDVLPRHLVIIGGSYIGLEYAQMFRRFGSEVTVIERSARIIGREDEDVTATIQSFLEDEGIAFRLGIADITLSGRGGDVEVAFRRDGLHETVTGSHLLVAVGRKPNTEDLGLSAAGIALDDKGYIAVNDRLETSVPGIWAMGDINGRGAFTHTSYNDFEIVAENLLDGADRKVSDRIPAYALYTDPPLGRVGMNEREARASGKRLLMGKIPMTRVGRAKERGETTGFMQGFVDADTRLVLGAAMLCADGDEIVHALIDIMSGGTTVDTIRRTMHIHPNIAEFLPTLFSELKPLD